MTPTGLVAISLAGAFLIVGAVLGELTDRKTTAISFLVGAMILSTISVFV